ncbi:hypothetical protein [Chitinimonas lacunae]|uniref:Uncharacterized protein n=1 Tax=Chitinimonas lacunae TaxID=1963018 RepID=A0ABV8MXD5_9NEIS
MKIRLMGPPDIVRAWRAMLEQEYGIVGAEYPNRGSNDVRAYFDLDDRVAASIAGLSTTAGTGIAVKKGNKAR